MAEQELKQDLTVADSNANEGLAEKVRRRPMRSVIALSAVLVLVAITLYLQLKNPQLSEVAPVTSVQQSPVEQQPQQKMHSIEEMVARLEARLTKQPGDVEGWKMLARSKLLLERFEEAASAYRKAHEILGDDPQLLADLAETLILAKNGFNEESVILFTRALDVSPDNSKALWMAGNFEYQQGNKQQAMQYWQRLLKLMPAGSTQAATLKNYLTQLNRETVADNSVNKFLTAAIAKNIIPSTSIKASIDVSVSLAPMLVDKTDSDDIVFVFARAAQGSRIPLAISRKRVEDLPVTVSLDDSLAMSSSLRLSNFNKIIISARVSKTGDALPRSGDLEGSSRVIELNQVRAVKLVIDKVLP